MSDREPSFGFWLGFIILVLIIVGIGVIAGARNALSHDWYGSTNDPVFQSNCCGGHDCAPVDPGWISETKEGFHLAMTLEQARTVNPATQFPVDAIIPWNRVQS